MQQVLRESPGGLTLPSGLSMLRLLSLSPWVVIPGTRSFPRWACPIHLLERPVAHFRWRSRQKARKAQRGATECWFNLLLLIYPLAFRTVCLTGRHVLPPQSSIPQPECSAVNYNCQLLSVHRVRINLVPIQCCIVKKKKVISNSSIHITFKDSFQREILFICLFRGRGLTLPF